MMLTRRANMRKNNFSRLCFVFEIFDLKRAKLTFDMAYTIKRYTYFHLYK